MNKLNSDVIVVTPFWKRWSLVLLSIIVIGLSYGTIQIWQTYAWLQSHTKYVRDRDVQWNTWMNGLDDHMLFQDREFTKIQDNQKKIMDHVEQHEIMMRERQSR